MSAQDLTVVRFLQLGNRKPSFAPFGGSSARPELGNSGGRFITPGPGTYGSVQRRVFRQAASSNAFQSKTIRFPDKLKDSRDSWAWLV